MHNTDPQSTYHSVGHFQSPSNRQTRYDEKKKQFFASFFVKDRYFGFVFSSVKAERKCSFGNFRAVAECFKKLKLQRIRKEHFSLRRKELNEKMGKSILRQRHFTAVSPDISKVIEKSQNSLSKRKGVLVGYLC